MLINVILLFPLKNILFAEMKKTKEDLPYKYEDKLKGLIPRGEWLHFRALCTRT